MTLRTRTPFEEGMKHFDIVFDQVRLFTTAKPSLGSQKCALIYTGLDETAQEHIAGFAAWLFPWLEERRTDIARFAKAGEVQRACKEIRLFAGPTEVLRELGYWGSLTSIHADNMVGQLATETHQYSHAYFEGGAELLKVVLGLSAQWQVWQPSTGRPVRSACNTLLVQSLPLGEPLRHLLQSLTESEQMRLLEQIVIGSVDTYRFPFEPLTC